MCHPFCKHPAFLARAILTLLLSHLTRFHTLLISVPPFPFHSILVPPFPNTIFSGATYRPACSAAGKNETKNFSMFTNFTILTSNEAIPQIPSSE